MKKSAMALGLCVAMLSGCVSQSTWSPTVDTFGNERAQFVNQDTQECRSLANQSSGSTAGNATRGAVGGGLLGAASGAALGAAFGGNAGRGAAIGAATAGIGTGVARGAQTNSQFQRVFNQCMQNRGHQVLG
jgi:uncharacterized protein YcfJ